MTQPPHSPGQPPAGQSPAGWFPDPQQPGQQRYWDGAAWTAHTQPFPAPGVSAPTSSKAIASLVLGVSSIVIGLSFIAGIPAMVLGRSAIKEIDASGGAIGGRGLARGGFWTGLIGSVLGACVIGLVIFLIAVGASSIEEGCTTIQQGDSFTVDC